MEVADQRWWDEYNDGRAKRNAYYIARAHVMASELPRMEAMLPDTLSAAQRASNREAETCTCKKELAAFRRLSQYLAMLDEEQNLSKTDKGNAEKLPAVRGSVLKAMNKCREAADLYQNIEALYIGQTIASRPYFWPCELCQAIGE